MPRHDWTRVDAGTYHNFHQGWTIKLLDALNGGILPKGYFAMVDMPGRVSVSDVVACQRRAWTKPLAEPRTWRSARALPLDLAYARKANRLSVRNARRRVVAINEIVSISAAATATLYNAGEFDAPIAERCLKYVVKFFSANKGINKGTGHDFYAHLYAAQGFYLSGDPYWDVYYPETRDGLLATQNRGDGSWQGDGVGNVYGTAIACIVLQLPFKFLPVFQR